MLLLSCSHFSFKSEVVILFFFEQKTANEMRMSDWSSDVCSSDLVQSAPRPQGLPLRLPVLKRLPLPVCQSKCPICRWYRPSHLRKDRCAADICPIHADRARCGRARAERS